MTGSPQPSGTDAEHATVQLHVAAFVLALVSIAFVIWFPTPNVLGHLVVLAVAGTAVAVGHAAVRRRGRTLWVALLGLVIAYFPLITGVLIFVMYLIRPFR